MYGYGLCVSALVGAYVFVDNMEMHIAGGCNNTVYNAGISDVWAIDV